MDGSKFIYVKDSQTKEFLEKSGYQLFKKKDDFWIFLNDKSNNFTLQQCKGVVFTNTLTF